MRLAATERDARSIDRFHSLRHSAHATGARPTAPKQHATVLTVSRSATQPLKFLQAIVTCSRRDVDVYSGGEVSRLNSLCIALYASSCAWLHNPF